MDFLEPAKKGGTTRGFTDKLIDQDDLDLIQSAGHGSAYRLRQASTAVYCRLKTINILDVQKNISNFWFSVCPHCM